MKPDFELNPELLFRAVMLETLVFAVLCAVFTALAPAPRPTPAVARAVTPVESPESPDAATIASGVGAALASGSALSVSAALSQIEPTATATATVGPTATAVPGGDADARDPGVITGIVYDSQDGRPVSNATIEFVGFGTPVITSASGRYGKRELSGGQVTLRVSHENYIPVEETVEIGPQGRQGVTFALSPALKPGQLRVVLTWGPEPKDLDAHMWLPNERPYHVFFQTSPNHRGFMDEFPLTKLDVDSRDGSGVETITINQFFPGEYLYAINVFSLTGSFPASGARVIIYQERSVIAAFAAPQVPAKWWTVFKVDGIARAITPINQVSNESPGAYP